MTYCKHGADGRLFGEFMYVVNKPQFVWQNHGLVCSTSCAPDVGLLQVTRLGTSVSDLSRRCHLIACVVDRIGERRCKAESCKTMRVRTWSDIVMWADLVTDAPSELRLSPPPVSELANQLLAWSPLQCNGCVVWCVHEQCVVAALQTRKALFWWSCPERFWTLKPSANSQFAEGLSNHDLVQLLTELYFVCFLIDAFLDGCRFFYRLTVRRTVYLEIYLKDAAANLRTATVESWCGLPIVPSGAYVRFLFCH